ncbi:terminase gpA endonuclease subunit [Herbaspirillum rubrisubalbicans]|uniref:Terminase large subunit GpA endonuclease domain-containing protein n=1 Tax=Herbaspirillum rubrisubalbicans TaxID=80842 RepID=A0AAD0XGW9_9BURK|nr:terminase gpA endonuclease subunit [Herbaspirillum rubrisubalbicans]AYR25776.1 hypothetical protein RC54_19025 [Herbaspirillum rubrisubalbicans]
MNTVFGIDINDLFRNEHEALKFAFNFQSQQYPLSPMSKLGSLEALGQGKGLVSTDGAAQAGMIRKKLDRLGEAHRHCLVARFSPKYDVCPCCQGEPYPLRVVQMGGLVLVAGIDVQDNRFEVVVWAVGRGEEMWVVDYMVLAANPAVPADWEKLSFYMETRFQHMAGGTLGVEGYTIDTGGHFTHQAYAWARMQQAKGRRCFASKGDSRLGGPVKGRSSLQDVNYAGKVIKSGIKLWLVGTDTAKDLIFGRLNVTQSGPGCLHFSQDLPAEFYHQLTAEARVKVRTVSGEQYRWAKMRLRNEVLDCTVLALFSSHMLDLHRYTERMWERLEAAVQPAVADMFASPPPAPMTSAGPAESIEINNPPARVQVPAPMPPPSSGGRRVRSRGIER